MDITQVCTSLKTASQKLALHTTQQKNNALMCVARAIEQSRSAIIEANKIDLANGRSKGMSEALLERLALDEKKINDILAGLKTVIEQSDPIGEIKAGWTTPTGLNIKQITVPLGVIAVIYESRPNVTVDCFCLAYKSANAILLRGSSSAINSNTALLKAIKQGLTDAGEDGIADAVELCKSNDHSDVDQILTATGLIDCALPRGGANLIRSVIQKAKIPVIQTGAGICHLYIDDSADIKKAALIAENAKIQRPGACNAIETILVHKSIAPVFLPELAKQLAQRVELRADETCFSILKEYVTPDKLKAASEDDYGYEFLDLICAVKAVESINQAIEYINTHSTQHSECIVTNNRNNAILFQKCIDSACVYVNASTRFSDGGQFGFGAEVGISTQKLHARGPMGIKTLTSTKYIIDGDGQIR